MTSPTQRRHEELRDLLTEIRDLLDPAKLAAQFMAERFPEPERAPDPEWDCAACGEPEPTWQHECPDVTVDVTECRDCGRSDGGCDRVDTAPDVDPDEALARAMYERADDEPGTWPPPHPDDLAYWMRLARVALEHLQDDLPNYSLYLAERTRAKRAEAERDAFRERLDALRDDLMGIDWPPAPRLVVSEALDRDDERGRDA